jgi:hypothetical protein
MCIIPANRLSSDDLAVLSGRKVTPHHTDEESDRELAICQSICQPGDAFGFGPICLSQIVRPVDPRDFHRAY